MGSRIKITQPLIQTREQAECLIGEIAALTARRNMRSSEMDREITAVRKRYEEELSAIDQSLKEKSALAQNWSTEHPEIFGEKKSIEMVHGIVGFRTGNRALKPARGWTWDRVLDRLRDGFRKYIRIKEEVDREQILIDCSADTQKLNDEELTSLGLKVVQEESFYISLKLETDTPPTSMPTDAKPAR